MDSKNLAFIFAPVVFDDDEQDDEISQDGFLNLNSQSIQVRHALFSISDT